MNAQAECILCMFNQALNTVRATTEDRAVWTEVLKRLAQRVPDIDMNQTPAAVSQNVYRLITEITGQSDPLAGHKQLSNTTALRLRPGLRDTVLSSADPLSAALHLAAAGNVIDAGIGQAPIEDIEATLLNVLATPFGIDDLDAFRAELRPGKRMLYLADNAGEIVFDAVLIEQLQRMGIQVTVSVKSSPIINDATRTDAEAAGIPALAEVIETGSNDIGIHFDRISPEFRRALAQADLVLAKGQGNYETCEDRPENFYFLLKAKCQLVADHLGVPLGTLVFRKSKC